MIDLTPLNTLEGKMRRALIDLPRIMGNEALNFAADNFRQQGFHNHGIERWKKRKDPTKWGTKPKRPGRALLTDTGRLRRAGRISHITKHGVTLAWDVPYARAHNQGARGRTMQKVKSFTRRNGQKVKAHSRTINQNIPTRRIIGKSVALQRRAISHGLAHINRFIK